jgi:hypothetical protein
LNGIGLKSLKNFPKLENLQILELNNNNLDGNDLNVLVDLFPKLYKVKLENNHIENLEIFNQLTNSKIEKINIKENPVVSENENYKKELFEIIPSLKSIDGEDKEGNPIESTDYGDDSGEGDYEGEEFEGDDEDIDEDDEENEEDEEEVDEDIEDGEDDDDEEDKPPKKKSHN